MDLLDKRIVHYWKEEVMPIYWKGELHIQWRQLQGSHAFEYDIQDTTIIREQKTN